MAHTNDIVLGRIVWAEVLEPSGRPAGENPCIVMSSNAEIESGADLRVVVCSRSFSYPLPSGWFDIPTSPVDHDITRLDQACVAKATWLQIVPQNTVLRLAGRVPARIYKQIKNWLEDKEREMRRALGK